MHRVGIIANPVSARDIRRVIANAAALQITDRANIVLRVLACLKACGIGEVVMMPENGGIRGHVKRGLDRSKNRGEAEFSEVSYLDMPVTGTVVRGNQISDNVVLHNRLVDLDQDDPGSGSTFVHNLCRTSTPAGLCR